MEGKVKISLSRYDAMQEALRNIKKRLEEQDKLLFEFKEHNFPYDGTIMTELRKAAENHAMENYSSHYDRLNKENINLEQKLRESQAQGSKLLSQLNTAHQETGEAYKKISDYSKKSFLYRLFNNI